MGTPKEAVAEGCCSSPVPWVVDGGCGWTVVLSRVCSGT